MGPAVLSQMGQDDDHGAREKRESIQYTPAASKPVGHRAVIWNELRKPKPILATAQEKHDQDDRMWNKKLCI